MSIKAIETAHGKRAASRVRAEAHRQHADLGILPYFNRAVAAHRDATLKQTHVIVGDHTPERKAFDRARGSLDDMR